MEHIAIQGHFPHIGPHVGNARLGHALPAPVLVGGFFTLSSSFSGGWGAEPGRCSTAHRLCIGVGNENRLSSPKAAVYITEF